MEQQGKTMDITRRFRHYYRLIGQEDNKDGEEEGEDAEEED